MNVKLCAVYLYQISVLERSFLPVTNWPYICPHTGTREERVKFIRRA